MSAISTASRRRIFYDDTGDGPHLLAITGLGGSRKGLLASLGDYLASRLRIIAIDNRDAGESDPEANYYMIADMAGDGVALLDSLGVERAHILGSPWARRWRCS